jgi:hypothetical protein
MNIDTEEITPIDTDININLRCEHLLTDFNAKKAEFCNMSDSHLGIKDTTYATIVKLGSKVTDGIKCYVVGNPSCTNSIHRTQKCRGNELFPKHPKVKPIVDNGFEIMEAKRTVHCRNKCMGMKRQPRASHIITSITNVQKSPTNKQWVDPVRKQSRKNRAITHFSIPLKNRFKLLNDHYHNLEVNHTVEHPITVYPPGGTEYNPKETLGTIPGGTRVQSEHLNPTPHTHNITIGGTEVDTENISKNKVGKKHLDLMNICVCNAQSVGKKIPTINEYKQNHDLDVYLIVESWLYENDEKKIGDLKENGYKILQSSREERRGGGVLCLYKEELDVTKIPPPFSIKTMEFMEIMLSFRSKRVRFVTIYRPEPSDKNHYTLTAFYREFGKLMSHYNLIKDELIICGDFNFHINKPNCPKAKKFMGILSSFNLKQHINEPTHDKGNTLDLLITRSPSILVNHMVDTQISDHNNILFKLNMKKPECPKKVVKFRKLKKIKVDELKNDIKLTSENGKAIKDLTTLVDYYNDELSKIFDKHAPEQHRLVTLRKPTPWTSDDIKPEKKVRRRLERKWRSTRLQVHYNAFKAQRNRVNAMLNTFKVKYYSDLIRKNANNPKALFKIINRALHRKEATPMPQHTSEVDLANEFSNFFKDKIHSIRDYLDNPQENSGSESSWKDQPRFTTKLTKFKILSEADVKKIVLKSPNKYCELDPIPTALLRECIDEILPILTTIINLSLQLGNMPKSLKTAIITPLLKKLGLELVKKNYRPVSNLAFLSKLIERTVAMQLVDHLMENDLMDMFQSAYREGHSTETALLRVQNDILMELDRGNVVLLVLLDLSAAFDTIDHEMLLDRLSTRCGIGGTSLKWFHSYLNDRTQKVNIGSSHSTAEPLKYGVPQGSVLGPLLFSIYNSPLGEIIKKHEISYHFYADDGQLYLAFSPKDELPQQEARKKMMDCTKDVKAFLTANEMKQNDDKTEFLIIGTPGKLKQVLFNEIDICDARVPSSLKARNLGVFFDKEMNLNSQVNNLCRSGFYHIRNLSAIRNILDMDSAKLAANAFVTSTLDYGNSLLYGLPKTKINKLQVMHNAAARVVIKAHKSDRLSMTAVRKDLHWLPVEARIQFKTLALTWKAYHGTGPKYLTDLINKKQRSHNIRSNDDFLLNVPVTKLVTCGDRAFQNAAPLLWNNLPLPIRTTETLNSFKSKLKTYLFTKYYSET